MTLLDAMGALLGSLGWIFTSPLVMGILAVLAIAAGVALCLASFGGFREGEHVAAAFVLLAGNALIFIGMSVVIWVSSSVGPFAW